MHGWKAKVIVETSGSWRMDMTFQDVQSIDGEELDCEPARAGSDGQKAAAVALWSLVCTATLAEMKPEAF